MRPRSFGNRAFAMAAGLTLSVGLISAYGMSGQTNSAARLQLLADEAALAGVNSLAASPGLPDGKRIELSIAAARNVMSATPAAIEAISPSVDRVALSVVLNDLRSGKRVVATAHYIPPSDGRTSRQASYSASPSFGITW